MEVRPVHSGAVMMCRVVDGGTISACSPLAERCTFDVASHIRSSLFLRRSGMAGDVNLFLSEEDGERRAEVEVMIAEASSRGKGMGKRRYDVQKC